MKESAEGWSIATSKVLHGKGYYREHYFDESGSSLCKTWFRSLSTSFNFSLLETRWHKEPKTCNTCFRKLAKIASKKFKDGWARLSVKPKGYLSAVHYFLDGISLCQHFIQHTDPQQIEEFPEQEICESCAVQLRALKEPKQ